MASQTHLILNHFELRDLFYQRQGHSDERSVARKLIREDLKTNKNRFRMNGGNLDLGQDRDQDLHRDKSGFF